MPKKLLPEPSARIGLSAHGSRFASACCKRSSRSSSDSSRASGELRNLAVSSSAMHLPCASPPVKSKGQTGTRNMAESDTAKAPTLYEWGRR